MDINQLVQIVKKKIFESINPEKIIVEDKSFLHKKHKFHEDGKFHLKLTIQSKKLKEKNKIEKTKIIYKALDSELKYNIHSLEILFK